MSLSASLRDRQLGGLFWGLRRQRILGALGIEEESLKAFRELVAACQVIPLGSKGEIVSLQSRIGYFCGPPFGVGSTLQARLDVIFKFLKHRTPASTTVL